MSRKAFARFRTCGQLHRALHESFLERLQDSSLFQTALPSKGAGARGMLQYGFGLHLSSSLHHPPAVWPIYPVRSVRQPGLLPKVRLLRLQHATIDVELSQQQTDLEQHQHRLQHPQPNAHNCSQIPVKMNIYTRENEHGT